MDKGRAEFKEIGSHTQKAVAPFLWFMLCFSKSAQSFYGEHLPRTLSLSLSLSLLLAFGKGKEIFFEHPNLTCFPLRKL
jgi:hypothetical protein